LYEDFSEVEVDLIFDRLMDYQPKLDATKVHQASLKKEESDLHSTISSMDHYSESIGALESSEQGIEVKKLIEAVQHVEMKDNDMYRHQMQLASFLMNEVAKRRLVKSPQGTATTSFKENATSTNKPPSLSLKEIDETIDSVLQSTSGVSLDPEERNRNKLARYIRLTNTKLDMIPFYHMRQKELELMHKNDANLKQLLADPALLQRRDELIAKLAANTSAAAHPAENNGLTTTQQAPSLPVATSIEHSSPQAATIRSQLDTRSSIYETMSSIEDFQATSNKPYQRLKHQIESGSGALNQTQTQTLRASIDRSNRDHHEQQEQPVYRCINGKRYYEQSRSSYERVGMSMGYHDQQVEAVHRQQSASADFYTPLIYAPSKPVSRINTASHNKVDLQKRQAIQMMKYQRQLQKEEAIKDRVELETIQQKLRELKRCEYRNAKMIDYKSNVLLDDMQSYKKSSNNLLSRKPNFSQAEKMIWNSQILPIGPDDRDFRSTTKLSF
jgi:hypothetical protein